MLGPRWLGRLLLAVERHPVELEPVADEPEAEFARDLLLEPLDLLVAELDDHAALHD